MLTRLTNSLRLLSVFNLTARPTTTRKLTTHTMSKAAFLEKVRALQPDLVGATAEDKTKIEVAEKEVADLVKDLPALNTKLTPLTFLHPNNTSPCLADVSLYCELHPEVSKMESSTYYTLPSITRYFSHIQHLPFVTDARALLGNSGFPVVKFDLDNMPPAERKVEVKEKKPKKDAAAAGGAAPAAEGGKKDKKKDKAAAAAAAPAAEVAEASGSTPAAAAPAAAEASAPAAEGAAAAGDAKKNGQKKVKPPKAPKAAAPEPTGPMPSMIDLRVGRILEVSKHPDAESLYVEKIDIGEETGPRTVCSGLVAYMTTEQIQDQLVIVVCNLKPVTMRGVKSFAMLLCATAKEGKEAGIEFVRPPPNSQPGERIYFEGEKYEKAQPEAQLNPKKKVFETIQPNLITLDTLEAAWIDPETKTVHKIRTAEGICKVEKFAGASLS